MRGIRNYFVFLAYFTSVLFAGVVMLFIIGYFAGSFIKWDWLVIPPINTWGVTMEELRITVIAYFITSICFYSILKEKY